MWLKYGFYSIDEQTQTEQKATETAQSRIFVVY